MTSPEPAYIIGMDEAGRGPVIGPMVIGIAIASKEQIELLREKGVNDSKKLSKSKREKFRSVIKETVHKSDVLVVTAKEINELMRSGVTLNEIEVIKYKELLAKYHKEGKELYLDAADVNEERFGRNVAQEYKSMRCISEHKADEKYTIVGAASILAKIERDRIVEELEIKVQEEHKGIPKFRSGYPAQAKSFLNEWYKRYRSFPDFVRTEWRTCKKIVEKYEKKMTLDDFFK